MYDYGSVIIASWLVFLVVWLLGSLTAKRDAEGRFNIGFWSWRIVLIIILFLLLRQNAGIGMLVAQGLFTGVIAGWIGAALTVTGIIFAIWARFYLGRNWSSHPTHKSDHELVTSGPYTFVRHPIYTGAILALFGSALTGSVLSIALFVIISVVFYLRIPKEERIMLTLFPDRYPAYQARTKKLVPFIW